MFYVLGGEYNSLNFHSFVPGTSLVDGPYETRAEAEKAWKKISEENRYRARFRVIIVEDKGEKAAKPEKT